MQWMVNESELRVIHYTLGPLKPWDWWTSWLLKPVDVWQVLPSNPFQQIIGLQFFFFFFTLIFSVTFIYLFCFYYFWEGMGFLFLSSYEGLVCHCIAMLFYMLLVGGIGGRESGY